MSTRIQNGGRRSGQCGGKPHAFDPNADDRAAGDGAEAGDPVLPLLLSTRVDAVPILRDFMVDEARAGSRAAAILAAD